MDYRTQLLRWNLVVVALLTWVVGMAVALTPDGLALIEFKNALTITSPLLESWNASDASPCSWGGVSCTDSGYVQNITLVKQAPMLEGNISPSLGKLKFLEGLVLDQNMLSGSIPPELGNLSSLRTLSLSLNSLTGGIPPELGNCSSLAELYLFNNLLSGNIPEVIYKNLNLTHYDVSANKFSGDITTALDDLSKLPVIGYINMEINNFAGTLPPSIGNATSLVVLSLGVAPNNGQSGGFGGQIPKELGNLVNLRTLYLADLNLTGNIPPEFQTMTSLNSLDLGQSNLRGEIPPWFGNMTSLTTLLLRNNQLSGTIPPSLGKLVNLTWLSLGYNILSGPIPSSIGSLFNLQILHLGMNALSGLIPTSFQELTNLTNLDLGYNNLTGQIPTNLSKTATSLQQIVLNHNGLWGPIPQDFGRFMPNLTAIFISNNFLNGTLPNGLCNGGKLQWLAVSNNSLGGAIPLSLASCDSLTMFGFQDNQFTSIPDGFGRNTSLKDLRGARNQLTGHLPVGLGANSNLTYLDLSENRFTGDISILEFSQLAHNLSVLNLAKNNFTGEIPAAMAVCKLLIQVDLSYNSLTGAVPLSLANLSNLQELHLQGNKLILLHPSIYSGFASTLRILNLAENPWNTTFVTEITSLSILKSLNLSYGGYTGPIPSALSQLTQLEVLDLSHNNLSGEVPNVLGELMTSLTSVNVSFNRLTGSLPATWVKFLTADPNSFQGNPDLCLLYNANNVCTDVSRPSEGEGRNNFSVRMIVGVFLGVVALALFVYVAYCFWRRRTVEEEMPAEKEIDSELNLANDLWSLKFEDIVNATENLNDKFIIGRGAHGVVYKVKGLSDTYPHLAVKKIVFTDTKTTLPHKTFWAEVKSVGRAKHRNLVRLLAFVKQDDLGFLVYDYVPNGDLHSALHNKEAGKHVHLTWEARLRIAEGVARGLAYLHHDYEARVVHRDIKSCNVLLDADLEPHISDFGLAKVLDLQQGSNPWQSTQTVMGSFGYIPPEAGYSRVAMPEGDVYSYGVLLLELLTGKEPTQDPSYGEALHLVAWVQENVQFKEARINMSVLDPSLLNCKNFTEGTRDEMLRVQEIAMLCVQKNHADRPTMRGVENLFKTVSQTAKKEILKGNKLNTMNNNMYTECCDENSDGRLFSDSKTNVSSDSG